LFIKERVTKTRRKQDLVTVIRVLIIKSRNWVNDKQANQCWVIRNR